MEDALKSYYVYVTSYVGNLGTKVLIEKKKDLLLKRFNADYLSRVVELCDGGNVPLFNFEGNEIIDREEIGKGGVLASLWKICDRNKLGLRYRLIDIPVYQGTIEICNFLDLNPYRLLTSNATLFISKKKNIENAYLIGETNNGKKRVRVDSEAEAFLTKYYRDEIDKVC